jgi:hypothetical protein
MNTRESIEHKIREAVGDVTGTTNLDKNVSLIDRAALIIPVCFLYIFDILEKSLELPVYDIFTNHSFEVMTVENLTDALFELETQSHIASP